MVRMVMVVCSEQVALIGVVDYEGVVVVRI